MSSPPPRLRFHHSASGFGGQNGNDSSQAAIDVSRSSCPPLFDLHFLDRWRTPLRRVYLRVAQLGLQVQVGKDVSAVKRGMSFHKVRGTHGAARVASRFCSLGNLSRSDTCRIYKCNRTRSTERMWVSVGNGVYVCFTLSARCRIRLHDLFRGFSSCGSRSPSACFRPSLRCV